MKKHSTVIVSNRLPISVKKIDGILEFSESDGGLATAVSSLAIDNCLWVGWPGIAVDDLTPLDKKQIITELQKHDCYPVFLNANQIELFYEGYSNDTLWPLFHYFESHMVNRQEYWAGFQQVNALYAKVVKQISANNARVWIHDYQLMLLPQLVKKSMPESLVGYFHHIPFPSYEVFRLLPERREILLGLLGADLVGFHIYDYARHFLNSCIRLLGVNNDYGTVHFEGQLIRVDAFPISVDFLKFDEMSKSEQTVSTYKSIRETYKNQKIIFSIDRLDYSKGIIERLEGYRQFLINNPDYAGRVVLNMVVSPSRTGVDAYQFLQKNIEQTVGRINGEFSTTNWMPINYKFHTLPLEEIVPLYMAADAMLVTPRRDGMNLVAKEFIAAKSELFGTLILSELTGAVEELPEAIVVNPNDRLAIAEAIKQSFEMPNKQQAERLKSMRRRIKDYPVKKWGEDYLTSLDKVRELQSAAAVRELKGREADKLVANFKKSTKRLLVLDYDGTLQTFKPSPNPSAAMPSSGLLKLLSSLAEQKNTTLCIVSGRTKEALEMWFGGIDLELAAEHGAWVKHNGKWKKYASDFEPTRQILEPILTDYTSRTPGSRTEHKEFASVWHYRNVPLELGLVRSYNIKHELRAALNELDVDVHSGSMIVEIKPRNITKKAAFERYIADSGFDFVLVAGDDYTDEDMFEAVTTDSYSIKVGTGETAANYRVSDVASIVRLLKSLT